MFKFIKSKIKYTFINYISLDKKKWSSSVENILTKNATKKNIFLPPKSISKAIPGGKYGCA